ncbi:MAG: tRNA-binding protein [Rhodobacteraceae bacterium]|nr:tRNA-binding protein [Paracoccaceae bacterium]MBR28623.1 tRNA-binding protein [Paracoccaceae bacterium]
MADAAPAPEITFDDFLKVDIRVGRVTRAEPFPEARKPAIKLWVDFGPEIGERRSSAQITAHYTPDTLVGRQVMGVVNFPPRQIGPVRSEVLILGAYDDSGVVLIAPDHEVPLGARMM